MNVKEMNIIRNVLSSLSEGGLVSTGNPQEIIGLISVDEIGGKPWGPTVYIERNGEEVRAIINKYDLQKTLPENILNFLVGHSINRKNDNRNVDNYVIADNLSLLLSAKKIASERGIDSYILTSSLDCEARDAGFFLASIASEISEFGRPFKSPCLLIIGGEPTVRLSGRNKGLGGRNQELCLAASIKLNKKNRVTILSVGTDGTDGPTEYAGAIIDQTTPDLASKLGLDLDLYLKTHNSSEALSKLNCTLLTSNTRTNLMDVVLVYVN